MEEVENLKLVSHAAIILEYKIEKNKPIKSPADFLDRTRVPERLENLQALPV